MAEQPAGDRTEQATPERHRKAREEGQVARSAEVNSVAVLGVAFAALIAAVGYMGDQLRAVGVHYLSEAGVRRIDSTTDAMATLLAAGEKGMLALAPVALAVLFVGTGVAYAQVGWNWSPK